MKLVVRKADADLQIVYSEVWAPNMPDAMGDFMTVDEVRKMAHGFLASNITNSVDTMHDNLQNGSVVVESFIARENDPDGFIQDAWVVGVYIPDPELWDRVMKGELNGFSMEAMVEIEEVVLEVDFPEHIETVTVNDDSGHSHKVSVRFGADGSFLGGETDEVDGHKHTIEKMTHTTKTDGHQHRMFLLEGLEIIEN